MKQVDIRNSVLSVAIEEVKNTLLHAASGTEIEVISNSMETFDELKDYIGSLHIGFREIYKQEQMIMQFKVPVKVEANH